MRESETKKWQIEVKQTYMAPFWRETQLVQTPQKKSYQGELMICRIKMQARVQLKVQFASNGPKLVLRNLEPGPPSKVGLSLSLGPTILIVHNGDNLIKITCLMGKMDWISTQTPKINIYLQKKKSLN
jgi:hypothetical protein